MGPRGRWGLQVPTHTSSAMTGSVHGWEGDQVLEGLGPPPSSLPLPALMGRTAGSVPPQCGLDLGPRPRVTGSLCLEQWVGSAAPPQEEEHQSLTDKPMKLS